jgi:hypothetical protein
MSSCMSFVASIGSAASWVLRGKVCRTDDDRCSEGASRMCCVASRNGDSLSRSSEPSGRLTLRGPFVSSMRPGAGSVWPSERRLAVVER